MVGSTELDADAARSRLYEVMNAEIGFDEKVDRALALGRDYLGVENAHLTEIDREDDYWKAVASTDEPGDADALVEPGQVVEFGGSYCRHTIEQAGSLALDDVAESEVVDADTLDRYGFNCYHGTALLVDGDLYGTLCFVSTTAREPFTEEETTFAELIGRLLEHEVRHERAAARIERLDEFAGALGHDLRSPLNVARARLGLVAEECDSEHVAEVRDAHDRIDALVADALTLAREGDTVTDYSLVGLADLVRDCWADLETDATLTVTATNVARANPTRLRRLLANLLRNGAEHAGPGATVTVGDLPDGFYVADDGPGIPPERRETVFEPGVSTDETGTGLGLNIVRQVASAHGWTVGVAESETGGARFEVRGVDLDGR